MTEKIKKNKSTATIGGVIFFLILYVGFFLLPSLDSIKAQERSIASNKKNRIKLKKLLEQVPKSENTAEEKFEGSLSAFVEKTAKEQEVTIGYIRPYGKKSEGVEIKIDEMSGEKLVKFIYEMENKGIVISRLNTRDYSGNGIWVVKFNLEKGK